MREPSPKRTKHRVVHVEPAWDTSISTHLVVPSPEVGAAAVRALNAWFHRVGDVLSTFEPASDISRWRRGAIAASACDPLLAEVLNLAGEAYLATNGRFDPWWRGGAADPTGLVKGWAVDRACAILRRCRVNDFMVNAGGDVRTAGHRFEGGPWRVGVECPWATDSLLDVIEGRELCVATSGIHRRGEHIVAAGAAVTTLLAVTVCGPNLTMADAFSTAAFACGTGADAFLQTVAPEWAFMIVGRDRSVKLSANWPGELVVRPC